MKFKIAFLLFFLFYCSSCGNCGDDIRLGEFKLMEPSKLLIPYTGTDTLIFEDENGIEHSLTSTKGRELKDSRFITRNLCEDGPFSSQDEYFDTDQEVIAYIDELDKQLFSIILYPWYEYTADTEAGELDSMAVFDLFRLVSSLKGHSTGKLNIFGEEHQNQVSESFKSKELNNSLFVGDTTLYDKDFPDVYMAIGHEEGRLFYNTEKGVLAIKKNESEYWVLKD